MRVRVRVRGGGSLQQLLEEERARLRLRNRVRVRVRVRGGGSLQQLLEEEWAVARHMPPLAARVAGQA